MVNHAKALDLKDIHDLSDTDKLEFLEQQVIESRKIIYRFLVELHNADLLEAKANKIPDADRKTAALNAVAQKKMESKANIEQVKINLDGCIELYEALGGDPALIGEEDKWKK